MGKLLGCLPISPGFLIEINIILIVVDIILMADLYNHVFHGKFDFVNTNIVVLGLSPRVSVIRGICLIIYLLNAILGIRMSKRPSFFKFACYMLIGCCLLLYTLIIAVSRYKFGGIFKYYTDMMLYELWRQNRIEVMEEAFYCCGCHGPIDYIIANRTWSKAACCELSNCRGCKASFYMFMKSIEMEIARDNIALFAFLLVGMIVMFFYQQAVPLVDDQYESESSEYSDIEEWAERDLQRQKEKDIQARQRKASNVKH